MHMKSLLSAGIAAIALGLVATGAQAAPASGLIAAVDRDADRVGQVETVNWYGYDYDRRFYGRFYDRRFHGRRFYDGRFYDRRFHGRRFYDGRFYGRRFYDRRFYGHGYGRGFHGRGYGRGF
jgi:hypothetical protein